MLDNGTAMDEQIKTVLEGFRATVLENRAYRKVTRGIQATGKTITWILGSVPAYFLMMALCVLTGLINFYIVLEHSGTTGGMQIMAGDSETAQLWMSAGFVIYGTLIGYAKRMELLSIGAIVWIYYAIGIFFATINGQIVPQGLLATVVYIITAISIPAIVVSKHKENNWKRLYEESLATFEAYKVTNGRFNQNPQSE